MLFLSPFKRGLTVIMVLIAVLAVSSVAQAFFRPGDNVGDLIGGVSTNKAVCASQPKLWDFETGLGIFSLGPFNPGQGLQFFGWFFFALMALTAVFALVMIAYGGVRYLVAAGNAGKQGVAKQRITDALLGLTLAMTSILILHTINPQLTTIGLPPFPAQDPRLTEWGERECMNDSGYQGISLGPIHFSKLETKAEHLASVDPATAQACLQSDGKTLDLNCMTCKGYYAVLDDNQNTTVSCVVRCFSRSPARNTDLRPCKNACPETWKAISSGNISGNDALWKEITGNKEADYVVGDCLQCASDFLNIAVDGQGNTSGTDFCECRNLPGSIGDPPPQCS